MKYSYIYVGIGISIVTIGIFLIYLFEPKQENSDLTQKNQINTIPKLSEDQTVQIVKSDLSKHLPNLDRILIVGKDFLPFNPNYPKLPLQLILVLSNETELSINNTDHSVIAKCNPEVINAVCTIRGNEKIQDTSGKLVYIVETNWYTKTNVKDFADYFVDANNGDILYSNLLQNIISLNNTNEYRP